MKVALLLMKISKCNYRKEKMSLESKAAKAEASLQAATSSLPQIIAERDRLRVDVKKFANQELELECEARKGYVYFTFLILKLG